MVKRLSAVIPLGLAHTRRACAMPLVNLVPRFRTGQPFVLIPAPAALLENSDIKKAPAYTEAFQVIPLGFEPRTHALKGRCSTS